MNAARVVALVAILGLAGCASEEPAAPDVVAPWFTDVTEQSGLDFVYRTGAAGGLHITEIMASGVAFLDYDGDDDLDIYLTNGNASPQQPSREGEIVNRLFRNDDGRFVDATAGSGLGDPGYGMGVAVGDYDNDGDPDVFVSNYGPDRLFRNDDGRFIDVTEKAGVAGTGWSASAVWCDYDRDGLLDLYATRYVEYRDTKSCLDSASRETYCGPLEFPPVSDHLFHNEGGDVFRDVSDLAGMSAVRAAGLGVVCDDFNDDGWPDFYVANDAYANNLWINGGDGSFKDHGLLLGAAFNVHGKPEAGMGVVAVDFDNDRNTDLFVTHLAAETNTYYRNLGQGRGFSDATGQAGLGATSMALTGFGTAAFDADLDGDLDIAIGNGRVTRSDGRPDSWVDAPWSWFAEPNLFYVNEGGSLFGSMGAEVSAFIDPVEITRGLAVGDYDGDGDEDIVISNAESPARLYRNDAPRGGHWIALRLADPFGNFEAIGARVTVSHGDRVQVRTVTRGGSYLSSRSATLHLGVGDATTVEVSVLWPDGTPETFPALAVDAETVLVRGHGSFSDGS
jgi:hypothetical protein